MKNIILLSLSIIIINITLYSQDFSTISISKMEQLKKKAAAAEDYNLAAKYKKAIKLRKEIKTAVANEDYSKAADLKNELKALEGGNSNVTVNSNINSEGNNIEFYNTVYLLNKNNNQVKKLEKQTATTEIESYSAFVYAEATSFWALKGLYSTIQVSNNDNSTFVVRIASSIDPSTIIKLKKLELLGKKELNRRSIISSSTAAAYAGVNTINNNTLIPITFNKIKKDEYEIIIDEVLLPGEYAFMIGMQWYLFGVKTKFSNNDTEITESNPEDINIYHLKNGSPKISWLGMDYSIFKIVSSETIEYTEVKEKYFLESIDRNNEKYVKHHDIENWLKKDKQILFYPAFSRSISLENISQPTFVSIDDDVTLTKTELEKHIANYKINGPGIGLVIILESLNIKTRKHTAHAVWFDFSTRKIIKTNEMIVPGGINRNLEHGHTKVIFLEIVKKYISLYKKGK